MAKMKVEYGRHRDDKMVLYSNLSVSRAKKIMTRKGANTMTHMRSRIGFYKDNKFLGDYWKRSSVSCSESLLVVL